jgi:hypothetical protein
MFDVGKWYRSKRGHLCRLELLHQDGSVTVTSHYTAHAIKINSEESQFLTETEPPETPAGTAMQLIKEEQKDEYFDMYKKYKHIVPDSIYCVKNIGQKSPTEVSFKVNGKTRVKKVKSGIKGATRCKIHCQTSGCKNTRDIKVQDAFQVTVCVECKTKKKKETLKAFLGKKKAK